MSEELIGAHGGYRKLKSFQIAQLVYDITVRFAEAYVDRKSRTRDQMVQAARSGVQNIAEGSQASATSKKTELKLTNVARASLEELKLDYEDFLRQKNVVQWERNNALRQSLVDARLETFEQVRAWINETAAREKLANPAVAANAALTLLNVACMLLDRQIARLAEDFEKDGGFTEKLYRMRKNKRESGRSGPSGQSGPSGHAR